MNFARLPLACLALTAMAAAQAPLEAQRSARVRASAEVGLRAGRDFSVDQWTGGAHLRLPVSRALDLRPSVDAAFEDFGDDFQVNGDLAVRGPRDQAYIGAGVGYVRRAFGPDHESGTGVNLFLGFRPIPRPGSQVYVEGRWTFVRSETIFRLGAGVAFRL